MMKQVHLDVHVVQYYQAENLGGTNMKQSSIVVTDDQFLYIFFCQFLIFFKKQDCSSYQSMGNPSWEKTYLIDILDYMFPCCWTISLFIISINRG